jgi:hypothetical protein
MGNWGVFDDESDSTSDEFNNIQDKFLPQKILKLIDEDYDMFVDESTKYLKQNKDKLYEAIYKKINKLYKKPNRNIHELSMVVGIPMKAIKLMYGSIKKDCKNLPNKFPKDIQKLVLKAISKLIKTIDENEQGWRNLPSRKRALNAELYLFSKAQYGKVWKQ